MTKPSIAVPRLPGYQKPSGRAQASANEYDDCLNETELLNSDAKGENIYAVIDETKSSLSLLHNVKSISGSDESLGLLGDIVSEIQTRNFDSIYSTSTLARKKKEQEQQPVLKNELYANVASLGNEPENGYSNMNSSNSSTSDYIHPSAINSPVENLTKDPAKPTPKIKPASTVKLTKKPITQSASSSFSSMKKPGNTLQATSSLRPKRPLTAVTAKTISNLRQSKAPDLVTSCSGDNAKSPDVLKSSGKLPLSNKVGASKAAANKPDVKSMKSRVAALQTKFESRPPTGAKGVNAKT